MTNCRPISILPSNTSISKVMENNIFHKRVYSFLNDNDISYQHQYVLERYILHMMLLPSL